jgi:enoyl-CoA hydratase/carnithine racemase
VGLIHHLVPPDAVLPRALEVASELAAKPRVAVRLNRQRFAEVNEAGFQEALTAARRISGEAFASGEPQAMMARFFAERRRQRAQA